MFIVYCAGLSSCRLCVLGRGCSRIAKELDVPRSTPRSRLASGTDHHPGKSSTINSPVDDAHWVDNFNGWNVGNVVSPHRTKPGVGHTPSHPSTPLLTLAGFSAKGTCGADGLPHFRVVPPRFFSPPACTFLGTSGPRIFVIAMISASS